MSVQQEDEGFSAKTKAPTRTVCAGGEGDDEPKVHCLACGHVASANSSAPVLMLYR